MIFTHFHTYNVFMTTPYHTTTPYHITTKSYLQKKTKQTDYPLPRSVGNIVTSLVMSPWTNLTTLVLPHVMHMPTP